MRPRTFALVIAVFGLAPGTSAAVTVLEYDDTPKGKDFRTEPYSENGLTTTVDRGHYELYSDATGGANDQAFNLDEQNLGLSKVTVTPDSPSTFDVESLDVINPADTVGEYTISAIGGTGGSIPAPTVAGPLDFTQFAPAFKGITALVVTQNSPGSFTFDDLTVNVLPEPASLAALFTGGLAVFALGRRRAR